MDNELEKVVRQEMEAMRVAMTRPSVLYRPRVIIDGPKYGVVYGENVMAGCAGFGSTLAEAMADFDRNWTEQALPGGAAPDKSAFGWR